MYTGVFVLTAFLFFFFNDTATTEIYTLSLHDALPIYQRLMLGAIVGDVLQAEASGQIEIELHGGELPGAADGVNELDRKSTRLNSSHLVISYAVFCLKKKKKRIRVITVCFSYSSRRPR